MIALLMKILGPKHAMYAVLFGVLFDVAFAWLIIQLIRGL